MLGRVRTGNAAGFAVLVLCLLALFAAAGWCLVTGKNEHLVTQIFDLVINVVLLLVGYYWGSSRGSKEKTEMLSGGASGASSGSGGSSA